METIHLEREYPGDGEFPYTEKELAHFLYDQYLSDKLQEVNSDLLVLEDINDNLSIKIEVNQINSRINMHQNRY